MESDKQHINLHIDAHHIALDVDRDKEQFYRQAESLLKQRYAFYAHSKPRASAEQLWVYVALEAAVNLCSDAREKSLEPVEKKLDSLNRQLESVLNS